MMLRAYLRASTREQDAQRAAADLDHFAREHGHRIAARYAENVSGTHADRPELRRLLADALPGDVLLVEAIDRLSRMPAAAWKALRGEIDAKGLRVVSLDLPSSHAALKAPEGDEFTARIQEAVNGMLLDTLAAVARKDYEDRRRRQAQGIAKAKGEGKYQGKPRNQAKREKVAALLGAGFSVRKAADIAGVSPSTVQSVKREGCEAATS